MKAPTILQHFKSIGGKTALLMVKEKILEVYEEDFAFAEIKGIYLNTKDVRTHGSLYEREIPLAAIIKRVFFET